MLLKEANTKEVVVTTVGIDDVIRTDEHSWNPCYLPRTIDPFDDNEIHTYVQEVYSNKMGPVYVMLKELFIFEEKSGNGTEDGTDGTDGTDNL